MSKVSSSTKVTLFWIIGLIAFVSLMLGGTIFLLGLLNISGGVLDTLKYICHILLIVCAVIAGFIWLINAKWNKTVKYLYNFLERELPSRKPTSTPPI